MTEGAPATLAHPPSSMQVDSRTTDMEPFTIYTREAEKPSAGCTRQLAPPQSREAVNKQFEELAEWTLDNEHAVYLATRCKKRKLSVSPVSSTTEPATRDRIQQKESEAPIIEPVEVEPKRQRLYLAPNAESIANELPQARAKRESLTPPPAPLGAVTANDSKPKPTAFEDTSDDEGYYTGSITSPTSTTSAQTDDDDHGLISRLAAIHHHIPTNHLPEGKGGDLSVGIRKDSEQNLIQERSAHHSKILRERAKKGRNELNGAYHDSLDDDSASEQDKTVPHTETPSSFLQETLKSISRGPPRQRDSCRLTTRTLHQSTSSINHAFARHQAPSSSLRRRSFSPRLRTPFEPRQSRPSASGINGIFNPVASLRDTLLDELLPKPQLKPLRRVHFSTERPHPASRLSAEQYGTQDRHAEYNTAEEKAAPSIDREARLRSIQDGRSKIVSEPRLGTGTYTSAFLGAADHGSMIIDHLHEPAASLQIEPQEPLNESHNERRDLFLINKERREDNAPPPDESDTVQIRPTAIAGFLAQKRKDEEQLAHIPLGELADIDINEEEAFKAERRRLRELSSDLKVIQETYLEMARVFTVRNFTESEAILLKDATNFVTRVVGKRLPGKDTRQTIVRVRDAFRRKCQAKLEYIEIAEAEVDLAYVHLLGESPACEVKEARQKIEKSTADLEEAFETNKQELKRRKKDDRIQENERTKKRRAENAAEVRVKKFKQPKLNKTDRELADLYLRLGEYEAQRNTALNQPTEEQEDRGDAEAEVSEEDEDGEGLIQGGYKSVPRTGMLAQPTYHGAGGLITDEQQDIDEITALEESRQQAELTTRPTIGQAFDEELMVEMQLAAIKRRKATKSEEETQFDDLDSETDGDEIDADSDATAESDSDYEFPGKVNRYELNGMFKGLHDLYEDAAEYRFGRYLHRKRAEKRMKKIIMQLQRKYLIEHGSIKFYADISAADGIREQEIKASDGNFHARIWIHKELVDASKMRARRARKMINITTGSLWYVDWEKTITTTTTTPAGASIGDSADNGDEDDLFGGSTPEPDKVETDTSTERPDLADADTFWSSAEANACALNTFIAWFAEFAPPHERPSIVFPDYYGQLKMVHDELRGEVEGALDGVGAGPWEEEFERKVLVREGGVRVGVRERLRVVVRRVRVKGARN